MGVSSFQVYVCGNSAEAKQAVAEVATKLGLSVLNRGSLTAARELENVPLELFPEWRLPLRLALGLTASFYFYLLLRDVVYAYVAQGRDISFRMVVSLANKVKKPVERLLIAQGRPSRARFFLTLSPPSFRCFRSCPSSCCLCATCPASSRPSSNSTEAPNTSQDP